MASDVGGFKRAANGALFISGLGAAPGTVLYSQNFAALADGAAVPGTTTGTGSVTAQAGAGRWRVNGENNEPLWVSPMDPATNDWEVLCSFTWTGITLSSQLRIAMGDSWSVNLRPNNGYSLNIRNTNTTIGIYRSDANVAGTEATAGAGASSETKQWAKLRKVGNVITAKVWNDGGAEPGAAELTFTDGSTPLTGLKLMICVDELTTINASVIDVTIDDITVTAL